MNQETFAEKVLHISPKTYANYENGLKPIPSNVLESLSDYYNVSIDYLLGRSDFTSIDNEYIHQQLGLSDKAINNLKSIVISDMRLKEGNERSQAMISELENCSVCPCNLPLRLPAINSIVESKQFKNLISTFCSYANAVCNKGVNLLNGEFKKLPNNTLYLADENFTAIGCAINIDGISNAAWIKNILDGQVLALSAEYMLQENVKS